MMSIFGGLGPYVLCRKMRGTRPMRKVMDEKVFICFKKQHFSFKKAFFLTLCLYLACQQLCSPSRKMYEKEKLMNFYN